MKSLVLYLTLFLVFSPMVGVFGRAKPAYPDIPPLPGSGTAHGRSGTVYIVSNLNDSGAGSLRNALEASGARIVVFSVSGVIESSGELQIDNENLYVAAQTSPNGIVYKGTIEVNAPDVMILGMRLWGNDVSLIDDATNDPYEERDGIRITANNTQSVIIAQCSFFGQSSAATFAQQGADSVIWFRNLIYNPVMHNLDPEGNHAKAIYAHTTTHEMLSMSQNVAAGADGRVPSVKGNSNYIINNYFAAWLNRAGVFFIKDVEWANVCGNYWEHAGGAWNGTNKAFLLEYDTDPTDDKVACAADRIFQSHNYYESDLIDTLGTGKGVTQEAGLSMDTVFADSWFGDVPMSDLDMINGRALKQFLLSDYGAGAIAQGRDTGEEAIISQLWSQTVDTIDCIQADTLYYHEGTLDAVNPSRFVTLSVAMAGNMQNQVASGGNLYLVYTSGAAAWERHLVDEYNSSTRVMTLVDGHSAPNPSASDEAVLAIACPRNFGGYPTLPTGNTAPTDADADGMADDWEVARGLDPGDASDRNGTAWGAGFETMPRDPRGYTNIEEYLYSLLPKREPGGNSINRQQAARVRTAAKAK